MKEKEREKEREREREREREERDFNPGIPSLAIHRLLIHRN
jgi:hypothetical protein